MIEGGIIFTQIAGTSNGTLITANLDHLAFWKNRLWLIQVNNDCVKSVQTRSYF